MENRPEENHSIKSKDSKLLLIKYCHHYKTFKFIVLAVKDTQVILDQKEQ